MRKLKWLLPLALFVPLLMAPSGGYPTFPQFQGVTVNGTGTSPIPMTVNSPDNQQNSLFNDAGTPSSGVYVGWSNNGTLAGLIGTGSVSGSGCTLGDFCITGQSATKALRIGNSTATVITLVPAGGAQIGAPTGGDKGTGSLNAQAVFDQGARVGRLTYGGCGTSNNVLGTVQSQNLASCTGTTGSVAVVFTTAYTTTAPVCTATYTSIPGGAVNTGIGIFISAVSTTGATVQTYQSATTGTPNIADPFYIMCMGT